MSENPILTKRPDIHDLNQLLSSMASRYEDIGANLKVPMGSLGLVDFSHNTRYLRAVLQWWVDNGNNPNNTSPPVKWQSIIDAISELNYSKVEEMLTFLQKPDVQQNYSITEADGDIMSKPPLVHDLSLLLGKMASQYEDVADRLKVPLGVVGAGGPNPHGKSLRDTLQWWHANGDNPRNSSPPVTWRTVIDVTSELNYNKSEEIKKFLQKEATIQNYSMGQSDDDIQTKRPEIHDLNILLRSIAPQYDYIGDYLKVPMASLGLGGPGPYTRNLRAVLQWWVDNGNNPNNASPPVKWQSIINAISDLNYSKVEEIQKFLEQPDIKRKYLP